MSPMFALRNLLRNKRRSLLTLLGVAAAIFVYSALQAAVDGILFPVRQASHTRLLNVREKRRANVLASRLPESLEPALSAVGGVEAVTGDFTALAVVGEHRTHIFFHGIDPDAFRELKGLRIDDAGWERFKADRTSIVVGHLRAEQMGWSVGQQVELKELGMSFQLAALLPSQGENGSDLESNVLVHRDYLQAARGTAGTVTVFLVKPRADANELQVAAAIDDRTSTTASPTETASEAAYAQKVVDQFVGFVDYLKVMGAITIVITLLGAINAVSMTVRERVREVGLLRTLGYTPAAVLGIIILEATALSVAGGLLGIGASALMLGARGAVLAGLHLEAKTLIVGLVASVGIGFAGGLLPGWAATRMTIVDTLRVVD